MNKKEILVYSFVLILVFILLFGVVFVFVGKDWKRNGQMNESPIFYGRDVKDINNRDGDQDTNEEVPVIFDETDNKGEISSGVYVSEEYSFEFKHLENITVEEKDDNDYYSLDLIVGSGNVRVRIIKDLKEFNLNELIFPIAELDVVHDVKELGVGSYRADRVEADFNTVDGRISFIKYYVANDDNLFEILLFNDNSSKEDKDNFNLVLETFQFK